MRVILRKNAFSVPHTVIGIQLHQAQVILSSSKQATAAHFHAIRHRHPAQVSGINANFIKQARGQIILQTQPCHFANHSPQQRRTHGVIHVSRARFMLHRRCQKAADPVFIRRGHGIHTAAHAEHIPYRHFFQVLAGFFWRFIWENINHFIIKVQQPFGAGNANRCGRIGLT